MAKIPIALVGVDHPHAADWHAALARVPEFRAVAHYDPAPEASKLPLAPPYDRLPLYDHLDELLDKHLVSAALVMLPLHDAETALLTLAKAGIHIMAEKPVARTAAGLQPTVHALGPDTVFYAGYCWRHDPIIQQIRSLVQTGILGELQSFEMRWVTSRVGRHAGTPPHRNPDSYLFRRDVSRGGMLQWLGCHFLDLMLHLSGQAVTSVAAMTQRHTVEQIEVEDTATCLIRFAEGMLGSLHVGYLLPAGGQNFLGLRGSLGWVHWDSSDGRRFTVLSEQPDWAAAPLRTFNFPQPENATYGGGTGELLLRDFARCIREGGANPQQTIHDSLRVLELLDAAYASADDDCFVSLQAAQQNGSHP